MEVTVFWSGLLKQNFCDKCIHLLDVPVVPVIFLKILFQMLMSTKKIFIHKAYCRIDILQASTCLRKYPLLFKSNPAAFCSANIFSGVNQLCFKQCIQRSSILTRKGVRILMSRCFSVLCLNLVTRLMISGIVPSYLLGERSVDIFQNFRQEQL